MRMVIVPSTIEYRRRAFRAPLAEYYLNEKRFDQGNAAIPPIDPYGRELP
jgi:hypothetical protein